MPTASELKFYRIIHQHKLAQSKIWLNNEIFVFWYLITFVKIVVNTNMNRQSSECVFFRMVYTEWSRLYIASQLIMSWHVWYKPIKCRSSIFRFRFLRKCGSRDADPKEEFLSRWSNRLCEFSFMEKRVCVDEIEESGEFTGKPYLT
jgi:hypothetical protein